ncbi:Macrolide export ATP-binding/permease protein MacB [Gimesia panareensis]|uniref:Macrolide export ATP-binding/permease protein MacB n=1 Tax=Gimesia panareensis TaxID=2527978 RepID=A0A518FVW4_9PLAN|nr:FtsX-like permease family protein [Gimesia panareensis]QDV20482.1 Macrolide export ATP-binding/permease protein MacB [Gimesia panareensis]
MTMRTIIWKELKERPTALIASLLAIILSVTALVAIRNVTIFSEKEVAGKLDKLGANVLILPQDVTLQDYYAADMHKETIPEEHVAELALAGLTGVEAITPKLCVPTEVAGRNVILTGILPQSEIQKMNAWSGGGMLFKKHEGCKAKINVADENQDAPESLAERRSLQHLKKSEVILGSDFAAANNLKAGDSLDLLGEKFDVLTVLPATGTVDDSRVFAHLHTVQRLSEAGPVVNIIEVMGCCEDVANGLVGDLQKLLPGTKVVTIANVVETQVSINRMMTNLSYLFLGILIAVGGASMASASFANVIERRREIGTLMALGATPRFITRLFLTKAVLLGLAGGICGYLLGSVIAVFLGPAFADVTVFPVPRLALVASAVAVLVTLAASYFPARQASRLDPCLCFKEV